MISILVALAIIIPGMICSLYMWTKVNNNAGVTKEMYSDGTLLRQLNGEPYVGDYHYNPDLGPVTGKDNKSTNQQLLTELYCYAPISANSITNKKSWCSYCSNKQLCNN